MRVFGAMFKGDSPTSSFKCHKKTHNSSVVRRGCGVLSLVL